MVMKKKPDMPISSGAPLPQNDSLAPNTRPQYTTPPNPSGAHAFAKTPFPSAAGAEMAAPNGVTISASPGDTGDSESGAFETGVKLQTAATGNSGTQIFGGYFSEEYLSTLRGRQGAKQWDEMRRSEAQISMLLNAIMNPIKAANWEFEAFDDSDANCVKHKELVEMCITKMIDFETFKHEALTVIPFGFSLFEIVHSVEFNHKKFGTFNGIKAIAFRSQKTIENWMLEQKTGKLLGVNQYTYSDLGGNQFIPGDFLLVITHSKEGDNYEGISALRPMLGAYKRKELYLKLAAIGVERYALGTPIGTVPKGKEKTTEFAEFKKILQNYMSHETSYIVKPEGWLIEIQKGEFDASKIKELLMFENTEFANAVVGNFLALGMNGAGGAYALGSNLGEFFTTGIQSYADLICDCANRSIIPNLVKLNYGDQEGYPKMKVTGISDKAGKELAETIKYLADARAIDPDKPLKEHVRKLYKLPKPDPTTAVPLPVAPAGGSANIPKPGEPTTVALSESIRLADKKYVKRFDDNKAQLKELMQKSLTLMYGLLKEQLKKKYNGAAKADKILTAKNVDMPGLAAYKAALRNQLAKTAAASINSSEKLVPKRLRLAEDSYDALPPAVRKLIDIQASLVAETQAADIEKAVFFQFTSAATASDDIDSILLDVDNKVAPMIEGSTKEGMSIDVAAADAVAHVTQQASLSFLFDADVLDGIESFTFTNEDPVSDICQELNGQTFAVGDPDLDRYTPPLHHNCKSRLVPNLKGANDNPEIDSGVSLTKKALDSITLCDHSRGARL